MKGKKYTYYLCFIMMLMSLVMYSNNIADPPLPKPNDPPDQPGLPIDGGLSYLFIAGVAYGIYAIRKKLTIDDF